MVDVGGLTLYFTSQWLKTSCGMAKPDVFFLISSAKPKLSATGRTAEMTKVPDPSLSSSLNTRPCRFPKTA